MLARPPDALVGGGGEGGQSSGGGWAEVARIVRQVKKNQDFYLKAKAAIWLPMSCGCHVRSTATQAEVARIVRQVCCLSWAAKPYP